MGSEDFRDYIAGLGTAGERAFVERHLLVCKLCRDGLVATGKALAAEARRRRWRIGVPAAAAAAAALALALFELSSGPRDPVLRGEQESGRFAAVGPVGGAEVVPEGLTFVWRSPGPDAHYALTVTDAAGDVVWTAERSDTTAALPADVALVSGAYYFWFVDAFLDGAATTTTGVQEFVVR